MILEETGESVVQGSPIHPHVAGLVLSQGTYQRYIVPVARFYATEQDAEVSDFYPVVHDTQGVIAAATLKEHWLKSRPKFKPQWNYEKSETYVSFQLKEGEPIADTAADALYLAYIYLATNQPEKAWKVLEDCHTRLGGLTGNPVELKILNWICNEVPHVLPEPLQSEHQQEKPIRRTPPYVACQLKAMALACDFLQQDRHFDLKEPTTTDQSANKEYERLQYESTKAFQKNLPMTIYQSFTRLQAMRRHLDSTYTLSTLERKRLLDFYQQSRPQQPKGALGYEWMSLSLDAIENERAAILARKKVSGTLNSKASDERLEVIKHHLKHLKPVLAKSSVLEQVPINLYLPKDCNIKKENVGFSAQAKFEKWYDKLPGEAVTKDLLRRAVNGLSSTTNDDDIVNDFPALFQIAVSSRTEHLLLQVKLRIFCIHILQSRRHIDLNEQESPVPLLCNVLYRILSNKAKFSVTPAQSVSGSFPQVVASVSDYSVPPILVYQVRDVYKDILATPDDILQSQKHPDRTPLDVMPTPKASIIEELGLDKPIAEFLLPQKSQFLALIQQYQKEEDDYERKISELCGQLKDAPDEVAIEDEAGKALLFKEKQQKKILQGLLGTAPLLIEIQEVLQAKLPNLNILMEQAWTDALSLANRGPKLARDKKRWEIEKAAGRRLALTKADLLSLYIRADAAISMEKTGLDLDDAKNLHQLIHDAMVHGLRHQVSKKIQDSLFSALASSDPNDLVQAFDLLAKKEIPGLDKPSIVLLQHEDQKILRPRQVSALSTLLQRHDKGTPFHETVEKVPMGGGKSKVILPVAAEEKANGDNLVVIEVPYALLSLNHADLNRTSQRLFGKRAYRFEFNRDSNCSPERLEQLYKDFTEVMTTRGYMVTTGESIPSLELKYVELLLKEGELDPAWERQVFWCDKILKLVHNYADCMIDEVHQGLWIKKKLNYTLGESTPIEASLIQNAIALFDFIDLAFIKEAPLLEDDFDWTHFRTDLATRLVTDPQSPLATFRADAVMRFGPNVDNELIAYLTNTADKEIPAVIHASVEDKASLAFFKQEINVTLKQTLTRRIDEKYGTSKRKEASPIEQTLAIPYAANNVPNERSRFGNELESINYSIQRMLIKGLSKELLQEQIAEWQAAAMYELFQDKKLKHIEDTPTAQGFSLQVGGAIRLSELKVDDDREMTNLHKKFQFNRTLISYILKQKCLKQIQHDGAIIHSDAFNHVDLYRSVQGLSGTPPKQSTIHQRLHYDNTSSLGTDGYVIEVINDKNTPISSCDYEHATQFVNDILTQSKGGGETRAIIDIRAAFQGVSNFAVAQEIAAFIRQHPTHFSQPLKQVLYFNDDQVLCAIQVNKPNHPIVIGTSDADELDRLLNSKPNERFSYYDQARITGTDLNQADHAHALVLVDDKISSTAYLQGSSRMRKLSQGHTLELVVPKRLKHLSREQLIKKLMENDQKELKMDNFFAAKAKMTNIIRRQSLSLIQDVPSHDPHAKRALMQALKTFFVDIPSHDLYALYGATNKAQAMSAIFTRIKNQLLSCWQEGLKNAKRSPSADEVMQMTAALQDIIDDALPNCLPEYDGPDEAEALEVEVQKEVQKEVETETIELKDCYDPSLVALEKMSWRDHPLPTNATTLSQVAVSLNVMCTPPGEASVNIFSENICASKNYAHTYVNQTHLVGVYLKPVHLVWYNIGLGGQLQAMLVTPEEAAEMKPKINALQGSWLSTLDDTVIAGAGKRPGNVLQTPAYQSLREQVHFFSGNLQGLANQEVPLTWLREQTIEKLDFFKDKLLKYRPGSSSGYQQLQSLITQNNIEGYTYIAEHPFDDFTHFDWKSVLPKTMPMQITEYKKVARAFQTLNTMHKDSPQEITFDINTLDVPVSSLSFVNNHLEYLNGLKELATCLSPNEFLTKIEANQAAVRILTTVLHMSLEEFYKQHGYQKESTPTPPGAWWHARLELLKIIRFIPGLDFKPLTDVCILNWCKRATTSSWLISLLSIQPVSQKLVSQILGNAHCDHACKMAILDLPISLDETTIQTLSYRCDNNEQISALLKRPELTDPFIESWCKQAKSSDILLTVLSKPNISQETVFQILNNPLCDYDCVKIILSLPTLNKVNLEKLAATRLMKAEMETLLKRPDLSDELIESWCKYTDLVDILLIILARPTLSQEALLQILNNPVCNNTCVKMILTLSPLSEANLEKLSSKCTSKEEIETLFKHPNLNDKLVESWCKNAQSIHILHLALSRPFTTQEIVFAILNNPLCDDHCVTAILKKAPLSEANLEKLSSRCTQKEQIETLLERNDLSDKLIESWCKNATSRDILLLVLSRSTVSSGTVAAALENPHCDDACILTILKLPVRLAEINLAATAMKCKTDALIEALLKRQDLTVLVYSAILKNPQLSEKHFLIIIQSGFFLREIYQHRNATKTVQNAILNHPSIDAGGLCVILNDSPLMDTEQLKSFLSATALDLQGLRLIVQRKEINEPLLLQAINHPISKNDPVLIEQVLANPIASPDLFVNILNRLSLNDTQLLQKIATYAFARYHTQNQTPDAINAWEACLLQIVLKTRTDVSLKRSMVRLIASGPINPSFGFKLLKLFGKDIVGELPLMEMIPQANHQEFDVFCDFETSGPFPPIVLNLLAKQCKTGDQLRKLITRPDVTESTLKVIVNHAIIQKDNLILAQLMTHPQASPEVLAMVANHSQFSLTVLEDMMITPKNSINPDVPLALAKKVFSQCQLQKKTAEATSWEKGARWLLSLSSALHVKQEMMTIIKNNQLEVTLGQILLKTGDEADIEWIPISDMIAEADETELPLLINSKIKFSDNDLLVLAQKVHLKEQIDAMLDRPGMTSAIADVLLNNPNFTGKIGSWDWLNEQQILLVLDKTKDFDSLFLAFNHANLTKTTRNAWVNQQEIKQKDEKERADASNNAELKMRAALGALKIKALKHALYSSHHDEYKEAAKAAFYLYVEMEDEITKYFANHINKDQFLAGCTAAINRAKPVLEKHRGYKQVVLDILNVIMLCLTLTFHNIGTGRWRFFVAKTDSIQVVDQLDENSKKIP